MNNQQPDTAAVECVNEISHMTWDSSATFQARLVPIISRYLDQAREQGADNLKHINETLVDTVKAQGAEVRSLRSERLTAECDALKASNAELREQLAANAKFISELQHTVRLVQGTHAQQVRECAEAAAFRLGDCHERGEWMPRARLVSIICEAFGAPVEPRDECEEACETEWRRMELAGETQRISLKEFSKAFRTAWKLAKGKP